VYNLSLGMTMLLDAPLAVRSKIKRHFNSALAVEEHVERAFSVLINTTSVETEASERNQTEGSVWQRSLF
jgi:hypothetical protein